MTPQTAYKEFLLKVNKNDTNANIKIPKSQFVLLFNEEKNIFVEDKIKNEESSAEIEAISELLELDKPLVLESVSKIKDDYKLPEDFLRRTTSYVLADKGTCKDNVMVAWIIKAKNRDIYLQNTNLRPSFEYQETFAILNNDKISFYKTDFIITEAYLNYYRMPKDLDIEGYTKIDGTPSIDAETDLCDDNIRIVINRAATAAMRNYESIEQFQLAQSRPQV